MTDKTLGADAAAVEGAGSIETPKLSHAAPVIGYLRKGPMKRGEWYVSRKSSRGGHQYLHDDGVWREAATRQEKGERVYGGWFATRGAAERAIAKAEGR